MSTRTFRLQIATTLDELALLKPRWLELARATTEPNPFYHPALLLPAITLGLPRAKWFVVALEVCNGCDSELVGLFPSITTRTNKFPVPVTRPIEHNFCFVHSPLVAAGHEQTVIAGLNEQLKRKRLPTGWLCFRDLVSDGRLANALLDDHDALVGDVTSHARPALTGGACAEPSKRTRKEIRTKRNRAERVGEVEFSTVACGDASYGDHLEMFLALEDQGWKGRGKTSLKSVGFDVAALSEALNTGILQFEVMRLDGRVIAMQLNLHADGRYYGFKSAFDEQFRSLSPGVLLLDRLRKRFEQTNPRDTFDSCLGTENPAVESNWPQRLERMDIMMARHTVANRALLRAREVFRSHQAATHEVPLPAAN